MQSFTTMFWIRTGSAPPAVSAFLNQVFSISTRAKTEGISQVVKRRISGIMVIYIKSVCTGCSSQNDPKESMDSTVEIIRLAERIV